MTELTPAQLKELIFALENQKKKSYYNPLKKKVVYYKRDQQAPPEIQKDLWDLPKWGPAEGFQIMREFCLQLEDTELQSKLLAVLESGQGVFRQFKNTLREYPKMSQRWFHYKEKTMADLLINWYRGRMNETELSQLGPEPEETSELLLSDLIWKEDVDGETLKSFRKKTLKHIYPDANEREAVFREQLTFPRLPDCDKSFSIALSDPQENIVAVLEAEGWDFPEKMILIRNLYTDLAWRGLGIANLLLDRLMDNASKEGYMLMEIRLPHSAEVLKQSLVQREFHVDGFQLLHDGN